MDWNWMDICIIIIIAINGLKGLNMGLILSFFSIAGYVAAFIVAKIYYPVLSDFILKNTNFISKIKYFILERFKASSTGSENVFEAINLPKILEDMIMKSTAVNQYSHEVMDNIYGYMAEVIGKMLINLASILIIFLAVKFALNIIAVLLDSVASLPVINQFNRLGGFIFGVLKGSLIIFILMALMIPIASLFSDSFIVTALNNSVIAKYFYNYNIILNIIKDFMILEFNY